MSRPCPACGGSEQAPLFTKFGHRLVLCPACGTARVAELPSPEAIRAIYSLDYFKGAPDKYGYADYMAEEPHTRASFAEKARKLRALAGRGLALDIGCANGWFLDLLGDGFEKKGVEMSKELVGAAPVPKGVDIWVGDFLKYDAPAASVDVATLWDVLDHVPDPPAFLRKTFGLLKPGGVLAINLGDRESPFARLLGKRWHIYIPPTHLTYFSRRGLERLLKVTGFEVTGVEYEWKSVPLSLVLFRVSYILGWKWLGAFGTRNAESWWGKLKVSFYLGDVMTVYARRPA